MKFPRWFCLCLALLFQPWLWAAPVELQVSLLAQNNPDASFEVLEASARVGLPSTYDLPKSSPHKLAWYRVEFTQLPDNALLVLRNTQSASVRLLLAEGKARNQRRGQPISNPQYSQLNMVFELPKRTASGRFYLGTNNAYQRILLSVYERDEYLALDANAVRLLNTCLGILAAFSALGFVFYLSERDRTSVLFAAALFVQWFYIGFMYGEAAFMPWLSRFWPHWTEITILAGVMSVVLYCEVYLRLIELPQLMPRMTRVMRALYLWSAIIVVITVVDWLTRSGARSALAASASFSGNYLIVLITLLLLVGMIWSCIKRQPRAVVVLLASFTSSTGHTLRASQFSFGWIGLEWSWSLQVLGVAIASSLITLALTQRFLGLRNERDRAQDLATHDALTGALNRLGGMTHAKALFDTARQRKRPLCVAILDLDHFKQVNDRFGHPLGDAALKLFAHIAQESLAGDERLVRLGGEEFVLLLPGCDQQHALHRVNTLRLSVQREGAEIEGAAVALTVSIGVAQLRTEHTGIDALINDADQALYLAKRTGRNRALAFDASNFPKGVNTDESTSPA